MLNQVEHNDKFFAQYLQDNFGEACGVTCEENYLEGKVICKEGSKKDDNANEIPFFNC